MEPFSARSESVANDPELILPTVNHRVAKGSPAIAVGCLRQLTFA